MGIVYSLGIHKSSACADCGIFTFSSDNNKQENRLACIVFVFSVSSLLAVSVFSVYVFLCISLLGRYREIAAFILSAESTFWLSIFIISAIVSAVGFLLTGKLKRRKRKKAL